MPLYVIVVACVVGAIAFLAGAQLGAGRASGVPEPAATPAPAPSAASSPAPSSGTPSLSHLQGVSDFAFAFRPQALIAGLPGGTTCITQSGAVPGHGGSAAGRSLVVVWLSSCAMQSSRRASFVDQLFNALERSLPNARANTSRDDHGITVTDFGYRQGASTGSVTLVADAAGRDLVISITLVEPVAP